MKLSELIKELTALAPEAPNDIEVEMEVSRLYSSETFRVVSCYDVLNSKLYIALVGDPQ